jgi:hypothetical protein
MPPTPQGFREHEEIASTIPLIRVIIAGGLPGLGGHRLAHLLDQLFEGFVETDKRTLGIVRFVVQG